LPRKNLKLGEMLMEAGIIHEYQLNSALSYQRHWGGRLGDSLIKLGYLTEDTLLNFLADQLKLTRIDLERWTISDEVLATVPADKAREYNVIPVDRKVMYGTVYLLVAMADPTNLLAIDAIQFMTGCQVRPALAAEGAVRAAIDRCYGPPGSESTRDEEGLPEIEPLPVEEAPASADEALTVFDFPAVNGNGNQKPADLEEKFQLLIRLLMDKGLLSLREFERLK